MNNDIMIKDSDFDVVGLSINLLTSDNNTIKNLHPGVASQYNFHGLKRIIQAGYDINKRSANGLTLLHYYAKKHYKGSTTCVKYLLENGADPTIETNKEITAMDIALIYNQDNANVIASAILEMSIPILYKKKLVKNL